MHTYTHIHIYIHTYRTLKNKMRFNENKYKVKILARKKVRGEINIFLNDKKLEQVKAIKYLGIHFDERLSFYNHIEQIADKSRALTYMLNRTAKLNWGLGHKSLKTIYEEAIVPLMTYGPQFGEKRLPTENASISYRALTG